MKKTKYEFDEIVKVASDNPKLKRINGQRGVIVGKSQTEEPPIINAYAVNILATDESLQHVWCIFEEDLQPTGDMAEPENFEARDTIKVQVDPKTGRGNIVKKATDRKS